MDKKKSLILSIVGVLVLIVVVVGISYAMYSFTGTGTKENVITTGSISVSYAEGNQIKLGNMYPESDEKGLAHTAVCSDGTAVQANCTGEGKEWYDPSMTFTVSSDIAATAGTSPTINYNIGLNEIVEGDTLTDEFVKINVTKNGTPLIGSATSGVLISSLSGKPGPLNPTIIPAYYIGNGTFTADGQTDTYVVRAWVDSTYNLPVPDANTVGENSQSLASTSESFSFKIIVHAEQAAA